MKATKFYFERGGCLYTGCNTHALTADTPRAARSLRDLLGLTTIRGNAHRIVELHPHQVRGHRFTGEPVSAIEAEEGRE